MNMSQNFVKNLKRLMEVHQHNVEDVANAASVSIHAVYKWFRGGDISPARLKRLADFYGVTTTNLYHGGDSVDTDVLVRAGQLVGDLADQRGVALTHKQYMVAVGMVYKK